MSDLFDGLDIAEKDYPLPNGKALKVVALEIIQRLDVQKKIQSMKKDDSKAQSDLYKLVAKLSVVNDDYEPYLTDKDLNKLARASNGEILFGIFSLAMELSGTTKEKAEEAKKK